MAEIKELTNLPGLNPEDKVIIKKLDFGEASELAGEVVVTDMQTKQQKINMGRAMIFALVYGIKEAPFLVNIPFNKREEVIRALEPELGKVLFAEINSLNMSVFNMETEELKKK